MIIWTLNPGDAYAGVKKRIAVLKIVPNSISRKYAEHVQDLLEVHLYGTKAFEILERNQISQILKEQEFAETCTDTECAIKIGKLLSVDMVVMGSISKFVDYTLTIKFVDVAEGCLKYAGTEVVTNEKDIQKAIKTLANRSADNLVNTVKLDKKKDKTVVRKEAHGPEIPAGYYLRGIAPGWSQFHVNNNIRGALFLSGFILAGTILGYTIYDYSRKSDTYTDLNDNNTQREFMNKRDDRDNAFVNMRIMAGITAALYIANWIDVLFFSRPGTENEAACLNHKAMDLGMIIYSFDRSGDDLAVRANFCMRF